MIIGDKNFDVENHTYIMGILNVTRDSFSDGGRFLEKDAALKHVEEMVNEGMHLLDIGGESTRPGYEPVSAEEEMARVIPVLEAVKKNFDVPISIDTQKAVVARESIKAGADLINDIWGLKGDPDMAGVIAEGKVACVLMHNRREDKYDNLIDDLCADLSGCLKLAADAGIADDRIILDPGIGFAKNTSENLEVLNNMEVLNHLNFPWLLAASRKSVIGNTLNLPSDERLEGTLALTALAVEKGACFVRVHDIKENKRVIDMLEAVYGRN